MGFESFNAPQAPSNEQEEAKKQERLRIQEANDFLRDDWQLAEGLEVDWGGEKSYIPSGSDPRHPHYPMRWNRNNDTLAAVSPDGHLMVTPWSQSIEDKLKSLSFIKDEGIGVPLSNNEMPTHPDVKKRWDEKLFRAKREREDIEKSAENNVE